MDAHAVRLSLAATEARLANAEARVGDLDKLNADLNELVCVCVGYGVPRMHRWLVVCVAYMCGLWRAAYAWRVKCVWRMRDGHVIAGRMRFHGHWMLSLRVQVLSLGDIRASTQNELQKQLQVLCGPMHCMRCGDCQCACVLVCVCTGILSPG